MNTKQAHEILDFSLDNDGIIPVTKAASNLADTIHNAKKHPTIITQNGYGIGVVMSMELFRELRRLARAGLEHLGETESH